MTSPNFPRPPVPEFLQSDEYLAAFVSEWEACRLAASDWTHAAHIATASCYAWNHGSGETYRKMRDGILRFNASVGGRNTDTSGYHESLTRFWSFMLWRFVNGREFSNRIEAVRAAVSELAPDRTFADRYYGLDIRHSREHRREWRAPNENFAAEVALIDDLCESETVQDALARIVEAGRYSAAAIYVTCEQAPVLLASVGDMNGRAITETHSDLPYTVPVRDNSRTGKAATLALWTQANSVVTADASERARLYAAACRRPIFLETR
jgi:Arc/MetJ-type ribon-helix-helix transcriptional regulator